MCEIINKYLKKKHMSIKQINNIKSSISKIWSIQMNLKKNLFQLIPTNYIKSKFIYVKIEFISKYFLIFNTMKLEFEVNAN